MKHKKQRELLHKTRGCLQMFGFLLRNKEKSEKKKSCPMERMKPQLPILVYR